MHEIAFFFPCLAIEIMGMEKIAGVAGALVEILLWNIKNELFAWHGRGN